MQGWRNQGVRGEGTHLPPSDFGRSVNPISTSGADYTHLITTCTPGFSDLPTALPTNYYQIIVGFRQKNVNGILTAQEIKTGVSTNRAQWGDDISEMI